MAPRVHVCQFHVAISEFASALSRGLACCGVGGPCPRRTDASSILFSVFRCYELMKFIIVVIDFAILQWSCSVVHAWLQHLTWILMLTCMYVEGCVMCAHHYMWWGTHSWLTSNKIISLKEIYSYIVALVFGDWHEPVLRRRFDCRNNGVASM